MRLCHIVHGAFQPLLAKHSKSFSLVDAISVGVDRMQRNFEPMRRQVETRRAQQLTNATAKLIIYGPFIEDELDVPKRLARHVHELYFSPEHDDFQAPTMWSLSNAFTSAFKVLDPIPHFKTTAKLGPLSGARDAVLTGTRYTDLPTPAGLRNTKRGRLSSIWWENSPTGRSVSGVIRRDGDNSVKMIP
jgi:hypothetical protein